MNKIINKTMGVEIISFDKKIFYQKVNFIKIQCEMGSLGILPGHIHLITKINPGFIKIKIINKKKKIFISGGILEIKPKCVTILADIMLRNKDFNNIDIETIFNKSKKKIIKTNIEYAFIKTKLINALENIKEIKKILKKQH